MKDSIRNSDILKAIAVILIINSHLEQFYPIPLLATGGAIGNALFFSISGYGLFLSFTKNKPNFISYFLKRLIRIYPALFLVGLFINIPMQSNFNLSEVINSFSLLQIINTIVIPPYYFIEVLLILYFLAYFIFKYFSKKLFIFVFILSFILNFIVYLNSDLNIFSMFSNDNPLLLATNWTMMFLSGIYVANISIKKDRSKLYIILSFCILIFTYVQKYFISVGILTELQILQHWLLIPFSAFLILLFSKIEIINKIENVSLLNKIIKFLSDHSLEYYIIHILLLNIFLEFNLPFPINVIVFIIFITIVTSIIYKLSKIIGDYFEKLFIKLKMI